MGKNRGLQRPIDFSDRGQQLLEMRRCPVGDGIAKAILRAVEDRVGAGHSYEIRIADLVEETEFSDSTVREKLAFLAAEFLVDYELVDAATGRYRFTVCRGNVSERVAQRRPRSPQRRRGRPRKALPAEQAAPAADEAAAAFDSPIEEARKISRQAESLSATRDYFPPGGKCSPPGGIALLMNEQLTPPNALRVEEGGWLELESRLAAYGVADLTGTMQALAASGVPPELAVAVVAHAEARGGPQGAWMPHALWKRLQNLRPGQDPTDERLWMPAAAAASPEAKLKAAADLEARYGLALDRLTSADVERLAARLDPQQRQAFKRAGPPAVRIALLRELARRRETQCLAMVGAAPT